jgi:DNA-binding transcriptional regulator YiaG
MSDGNETSLQPQMTLEAVVIEAIGKKLLTQSRLAAYHHVSGVAVSKWLPNDSHPQATIPIARRPVTVELLKSLEGLSDEAQAVLLREEEPIHVVGTLEEMTTAVIARKIISKKQIAELCHVSEPAVSLWFPNDTHPNGRIPYNHRASVIDLLDSLDIFSHETLELLKQEPKSLRRMNPTSTTVGSTLNPQTRVSTEATDLRRNMTDGCEIQ